MRKPLRLIASTCACETSYACTSTPSTRARCAPKILPIAPQPMMQIFIASSSRLFRAGIKFPVYLCQILAFFVAHAISVLRVEANFAILIYYLRMKRENHVLAQQRLGFRADRRMLDHGHANGM